MEGGEEDDEEGEEEEGEEGDMDDMEGDPYGAPLQLLACTLKLLLLLQWPAPLLAGACTVLPPAAAQPPAPCLLLSCTRCVPVPQPPAPRPARGVVCHLLPAAMCACVRPRVRACR